MRISSSLMSNCSLKWWAPFPALAALVMASPAQALQPVDEFVAAARVHNLDNREAQATADQRGEEARQAWSRIGPNVTVRASYTRNQYEAQVQIPGGPGPVTITPIDQLDATFTLNL